MEPAHGPAYFRFYAALNDHLPSGQRYQTIEKRFDVPATVKDVIEGCGVPLAEVELIVVDGEPVDFAYTVRPGDRIAIYPAFETIEIPPALRVR